MVELIKGKYSSALLQKGTVLSLSEKEEERLIERKVAVKVKEGLINSEATKFDSDVGVSDKVSYITEDEIKKMKSKKEIVEYAASIGLSNLDETEKKDALVNEVLNYVDEKIRG